MEKQLYQILEEYGNGEFYPFHMPGHKRNISFFQDPYSIDITEIDGFDNLHHADGILKESMDAAAKLYQVEHSYFLVNGTTGGLLAALDATCEIGATVMIDRGCHKAVYHGVSIRNLKPVYFYKNLVADEGGYVYFSGTESSGNREDMGDSFDIFSGVNEEVLARCSAIVITTPTYEGVMIPLEQVVRKAHEKGIPVIVDEAHGAHLPFLKDGSGSALKSGADIVIQSLHKTLPSMTQTSILHVQGNLINRERLENALSTYQSSSPSYVLMSSIDACIHYLQVHSGAVNEHDVRMDKWRQDVEKLPHIWILRGENVDRSRLTFAVDGMSGPELMEVLRRRYHLEMEMCSRDYVVAITTFCDTDQGLQRLLYALWELNQEGESSRGQVPVLGIPWNSSQSRQVMTIYEAERLHETEKVSFDQARGRICGEMITVYPPGIPFYVPGEELNKEGIAQIQSYLTEGFEVQGIQDQMIRVIKEK